MKMKKTVTSDKNKIWVFYARGAQTASWQRPISNIFAYEIHQTFKSIHFKLGTENQCI